MSEGAGFNKEEYWRKKQAKKNKEALVAQLQSSLPATNMQEFANSLMQSEKELSEDEVADQMFDYMKHFEELIKSGNCPDAIIFALKAAAPIGVMTKKLWSTFYPDIPMPAIRYANVGLKVRAQMGYTGTDIDKLKLDVIEPVVQTLKPEVVQSTYVKTEKDGTTHPYQNILCVDDFSQSGATIKEMTRLFHETFPDTHVDSFLVFKGMAPWYKEGHSDIDMLGIQDWTEETYEQRTIQQLNSMHRGNGFFPIERFQDIMGRPDKAVLLKEYNEIEQSFRESPYVTATQDLDREKFAEGRALIERIVAAVQQKKFLEMNTPQ